MKQFKGPKYQQGKLDWRDEADYNHPASNENIKNLVKKAKVTQVTLGEKSMMYVYVPKAANYSQKEQFSIHKRIVDEFSKVYPDTPIFMGWMEMEFSEIDNKTAFKGKLKGTML